MKFLIFIMGAAVGILGPIVLDWFMRQTRGEFHCPTCGTISPLPKDDGP